MKNFLISDRQHPATRRHWYQISEWLHIHEKQTFDSNEPTGITSQLRTFTAAKSNQSQISALQQKTRVAQRIVQF
jgi:hypothetical protein